MNVVVTGGGTIAPIDDVRLMTNVSSGRFAAAITEACLDRGADGLAHPHRLPRSFRSSASTGSTSTPPTPPRSIDRLAKAPRKMAEPARSLAARSPRDRQRRRLCRDLERTASIAADRRRLPADGGRRFRARAAAGKNQLRRRIAGLALPAHAQGDSLWSATGLRRSTWSDSNCCRVPAGKS